MERAPKVQNAFDEQTYIHHKRKSSMKPHVQKFLKSKFEQMKETRYRNGYDMRKILFSGTRYLPDSASPHANGRDAAPESLLNCILQLQERVQECLWLPESRMGIMLFIDCKVEAHYTNHAEEDNL
ncbi:hypothetical protein AVEN_273096-1 [Araneus ventricosus]|uniref:Uncharacterized protein n=1 Tax=Araneus ventricosus TaxID=182803 RepID=A0A4Y2NS81_ARAVE|nr:hypothetical protein AVEN_273096-1 [Araneus ventricosus]